ncbi:MAG: IS66 family transposase [Geodermatophilaceae bacterium]|nr:IS66 family transposase [Geodermatophilaceae bacterium]
MDARTPSSDDPAGLVRELRDRVAELERDNADLRRQLRELRDEKPPPTAPSLFKSSLPPGRKGKKPGRPAGHPPALRPPPPEIHQEVDVPLPAGEGDRSGGCLCPVCRGELADLKDHERVVEEIAPAAPRVTRYRTKSGYCPHCEKRVESRHAEQPPAADLPHAQLGLNALVAAAALKHDAGLPYRKVARVLADLCGLTVSPGALPKQVRRLGAWPSAPGGSYDAIRDRLRAGAYANADETGWRVGGVNHWLWAITNPDATLYHVDKRRSAEVVRGFLGDDFAGHLVSDFLPTYDKLPYKAQKCIPHLLRDIERSTARSPPFAAGGFGKKLKRASKDMLRLKGRWDDFGDDAYEMRASRIADRLDRLARTASDDKDVRRLAKRLRRHAPALAAFLLVRDLPGDNNAAERAIRPAVIIRKISGGHRGGSTATASAAVMSVLRTVRQQGRHLIETVKGLVQDHLANKSCNLFTPAAQ